MPLEKATGLVLRRLARLEYEAKRGDPAIRKIAYDRYTVMRGSIRVLVEHAVESGELSPQTDVDDVTGAFFALVPGYALQRLLIGNPDKESFLRGVKALYER